MNQLRGSRYRPVTPVDVADARLTVDRLLIHSRKSRFESLTAGAAAAPSEDELAEAAAAVVAAASTDPLGFAILGGRRTEQQVRGQLSSAFAAIKAGDPDQLSPDERSALEAISLLTGRPALLVLNDDFELPTGVWELLAPYRPSLRKMLAGVARLELPPNYGSYVGSAFVVGPGLVMTNRHVLDAMYTVAGEGWALLSGMNLTLDFKREHGSDARSVFEVAGIAALLPEPDGPGQDVDLALLRVKQGGVDGQHWPAPLRVQADVAAVKTNRFVCVAGYPDVDEERNDPVEMDRIYGSVYQVKRLSPGKITAVDAPHGQLSHDCTTLGGNSGSCVFDLETNSVVGLHWGGDYLKPNQAVLLAGLAKSPLMKHLAGVNFQEG